MRYRPEIDGLRAVAVLSVILFHAGMSRVPGGYLGVDIFFVISGYLITSIISTEMDSDRFSFVDFYERRARRILPPLFLVVLTCVPFALFAMVPRDLLEFSKSLLAVCGFVSNIFFWQQSGYFDTAAELKPLLHTWSLGVEEQFYLAFPLILMLALRLGRKHASMLFLAVAVISLAYAQWDSAASKETVFFLIPGRIWELLMGALIPLVPSEFRRPVPRWAEEVLGLLGLALIGYSILIDNQVRYPGIYSLPPTVGALLIIVFSNRETLTGKLLGSRIPVAIGLVSYSAYLWHQPIFVFARLIRLHKPDPVVFLILSALSIALAALTYEIVERPVRDRKRLKRSGIVVLSATGTALIVLIGSAGVLTRGFENAYISRSDLDSRQTYDLIKRNTGGELTRDMGTDNDCNYWVPKVDDSFRSRFAKCAEKYGRAIVVLGDSHAMNIYNALFRVNYARFVVGVSNPGCRPWDRGDDCPYAGFDQFLKDNKNSVKLVIVNFSGSHLILDQAGREEPTKVFEYGWNYNIYDKMIAYTCNYLDQMSELAHVVWLGPFVEARVNFRDVEALTKKGFHINLVSMQIFAELERTILRSIVNQPRKFEYISFADIIKPDPNFLRIGDCVTFRDGDHFSICGEKIVGESLKQKLPALTRDAAPD